LQLFHKEKQKQQQQQQQQQQQKYKQVTKIVTGCGDSRTAKSRGTR